MTARAADDFATIAARMRELKCEPVIATDVSLWWCDTCNEHVNGSRVIGKNFPDIPRHATCGCEVDEHCTDCDNCGWICYGTGRNDPHFRECEKCGNPRGYPSP